jgi:hypothetical protein
MDQGPPSSKTDEPCVNSTENAESDSEKCTSEKSPTAIGDEEKVNWAELLLLCIPIALISFLVWLDETILATAIPKISDEFSTPSARLDGMARHIFLACVLANFPLAKSTKISHRGSRT